ITSAPKSDSTVAAAGAAIKLAQSRTLRPSKMPRSMVAPVPFVDFPSRHLIDVIERCNGGGGMTRRTFPRHPEEPRTLRGVSKDGRGHRRLWPSFEARREERRAPQDDDESVSAISAALPPAAAVLTVTVCSVANRAR